jgi:hypothetical protein
MLEEASIIQMDSSQTLTPHIVDYSTKLIQQIIQNAIGLKIYLFKSRIFSIII